MLLSKRQFVLAVIIGGPIGALAARVLNALLGGTGLDLVEIAGAAWIGTAIGSAFMMIRNSDPGRRRTD